MIVGEWMAKGSSVQGSGIHGWDRKLGLLVILEIKQMVSRQGRQLSFREQRLENCETKFTRNDKKGLYAAVVKQKGQPYGAIDLLQ